MVMTPARPGTANTEVQGHGYGPAVVDCECDLVVTVLDQGLARPDDRGSDVLALVDRGTRNVAAATTPAVAPLLG